MTTCRTCGTSTGKPFANYCDACRPARMAPFSVGDPRAVAAGKKGGTTMRGKKSPDYYQGYNTGWVSGVRAERKKWEQRLRERAA